jgi:hypothetical protein
MESTKIIPKNYHRKNNSFIFKNCKTPFFNSKIHLFKKSKVDYENMSLKSKNTQSISTGPEDKKESTLKKSQSHKGKDLSHLLNNLSKKKNVNEIELLLKRRRKGSTPEKNANEVIDINEKDAMYSLNDDRVVKNRINDVKKNIIILLKNKKVHPKINNNNKIGKIYKEDNKIRDEVTQIKKIKLKDTPPKLNDLFYTNFNLSKNRTNNDNSSKLLIPNVFINHLMVDNANIYNKSSRYFLLSTTNRIKSKKITLLYYRPRKTNY